MQLKNSEVLAIPPINAWLLLADDASEPTKWELRDRFSDNERTNVWTGPPHARVGDLLLFYFVSPHKAIRYAARVASEPFFSSEIEVNANSKVTKHQWWIEYTPLVPVSEVTFQELKAMHGGHLILKGQSGKYLSPVVISETLALMRDRGEASSISELESVVQIPIGDPDLPTPATMTKQQWAVMADGAFKREIQVEDYVVAPLLMFVKELDNSLVTQAQYPAGRGRADWGVLRDGVATAVIETKIGVGEPGGVDKWLDSPAFSQLRRYMDKLNVPGLLIDARRIMLVAPGANSPSKIIDRRTASDSDFITIGDHLGVKR